MFYIKTLVLNITSFNFPDCHIRLYKTGGRKLQEFQDVLAQNVGWSIVDTAYRWGLESTKNNSLEIHLKVKYGCVDFFQSRPEAFNLLKLVTKQ